MSRGWALAVVLSVGCSLPLDDKPCPCAPGYVCVDERCVEGEGMDAGRDAGEGTDAGLDAGMDAAVAVDAGRDAGLDGGPTDAGLDAGADAGSGLLAHFDCESLTGIRLLDVSGNGRHATCDTDAGCPSVVPGPVGNGCDFTSEAVRLRLDYDDAFVPGRGSGPATISVALWIFVRRVAVIGAIGVPQAPTGANNRNTWQVVLNPAGALLDAGGVDAGPGIVPNFVSATADEIVGMHAPFFVPLDTWFHVAITFDGTIKTLWVDGVEVASEAGALTSLDGELHPVFIGADENPDGVDLALDGVLDEIRIYDRVLSRAEIEALHAERD